MGGWLAALGVATCSPHGVEPRRAEIPAPTVAPPPAPAPAADAVVLVTIDGVRWQDVFEGTDPTLGEGVPRMTPEALLPNVYDLARHGGAALGAPGHGAIVASGPEFVSLPGYIELLTGHPSRCGGNDCERADGETIVEELAARGESVAVFASWERIARAAARGDAGFALSAGRSIAKDVDPAILADGANVGPWPGGGDFRPDRFTARAALAYLETKRPRFLFLGLGEPDEYAHHGDYAGYVAALRAADAVVGQLRATLARMGARGARTTVVVTTDHGRAREFRPHGGAWPESSRVWLVAGGAGIGARGFAESTETRALADVAPTLRRLLGLPSPAARPGDGVVLDEILATR